MEKVITRKDVVLALGTATSGKHLAASLRLPVNELVEIITNGLREKEQNEEVNRWIDKWLDENQPLDLCEC